MVMDKDSELILEIGEYFAFLDVLKESGETNMFGAGSYLQEEFNMNKYDARKILSAWMTTFGNSNSVDLRVEQALKDWSE